MLKSPLSLLIACTLFFGIATEAFGNQAQFTTFEPGGILFTDSRDKTLDEAKDLGSGWIRVVLYWHKVAPQSNSAQKPAFNASDPNGPYDWSQYDQIIASAKARGLKVLVTISGPVPRWATKTKRDNLTEPSSIEFEQFVTAVGRRYVDDVAAWSIWNEPNHPDFLGPQFKNRRPYSPILYRNLFAAGARGLKASGNQDDLLLIGETAPRGTPRVVAPLAFLRGTLCLNKRYKRVGGCKALQDVDGYAHHAYSTRLGPFFMPLEEDDVTIGVLSRLTKALDKAGAAGAIKRGLKIYLTEFGVQSFPDRLVGVSVWRQAEYLAISEKKAYDNGRVASFSQYLMQDDGGKPGGLGGGFPGFESGLRYANGKAKPAYDGFRLPLVARQKGKRIALWGLVRPAHTATEVRILRADGRKGFKLFKVVRTNSAGYWKAKDSYRKGRLWKAEWISPEGKTFSGPPIHSYIWKPRLSG